MEGEAPISQRDLITKREYKGDYKVSGGGEYNIGFNGAAKGEYNITAGGGAEFTDIRGIGAAETKVVAMHMKAPSANIEMNAGHGYQSRGDIEIGGGLGYKKNMNMEMGYQNNINMDAGYQQNINMDLGY
jgi:hypothetical protein